jgi:hypothetical protein
MDVCHQRITHRIGLTWRVEMRTTRGSFERPALHARARGSTTASGARKAKFRVGGATCCRVCDGMCVLAPPARIEERTSEGSFDSGGFVLRLSIDHGVSVHSRRLTLVAPLLEFSVWHASRAALIDVHLARSSPPSVRSFRSPRVPRRERVAPVPRVARCLPSHALADLSSVEGGLEEIPRHAAGGTGEDHRGAESTTSEDRHGGVNINR